MPSLNVETTQKLLVSASTIMLFQNTLMLSLIVISIGLFQQAQLLSLIQIVIFGLDIVGIVLLGLGLYRLSKVVPKAGLFAENAGLLFLFWGPLTLIWRLSGRFFSPSSEDVTQLGSALSTTTEMLWVFSMAALVLTFAIFNLNKMIGRSREHGFVLEGGGGLYVIYAILNIIGAIMLTFGFIGATPFLEQLGQIDPSNPPSSFEFARGSMLFLFLSFIGQFIKGLVVPILGLMLFSQLRGVFRKIEFQFE
ncbi:MAG: hypothetical protein ACE5I5_07130 [Candidatus Heimdallarchaeota archaeon]